MAKLIENEVKGIQLKEGQKVLDVDGNEYLIEKGDVLQESSLQERTGDWRLPDKEELNSMYENLHKKGIGNFANVLYWSSSDDNSSGAWYQYFYSGSQYINDKYNNYRVRLVRFIPNEGYEIGDETPTGFVVDEQGARILECKKQDEPKEMAWDEAMNKFGA